MLSPTDVPAYCDSLLCQLTVTASKGRNSLRAALESPTILAGTNAAGQSPALQVAGTNAADQSPAINVDFGKVLKCYIFLSPDLRASDTPHTSAVSP